jgi:hypothetical protein
MPFGLDTGISRETSNSVQTAQKTDEVGSVVEMETFGGIETTTEEIFSTTFANAAVNGQTGTPSAAVITEHSLIENNEDYARERKVQQKPLAAPA